MLSEYFLIKAVLGEKGWLAGTGLNVDSQVQHTLFQTPVLDLQLICISVYTGGKIGVLANKGVY